MLVLNLKKEWFVKIKAGQKTHEYRDVKPYFTTRLSKLNPGDVIMLRWGYIPNPAKELLIKIEKISIIKDGMTTDLKHNNPVFDIKFELINGEC